MTKTVEYWLTQATDALQNACDLADERGEGFTWSGPNYGMGGSYVAAPKRPMTRSEAMNVLASGERITPEMRARLIEAIDNDISGDNDWDSSTESGWNASSNC